MEVKWSEWNPGSFALSMTFREILNTMPSAPIGGIPRLVKLIENPLSPYHLAGPAALKAHDIIHVAFGRGLLQQDEAFVIGATMGNSSAATNLDRLWFLDFAATAYPKPFTFSDRDAGVFNLAFDFGVSLHAKDIHLLDVERILDIRVDAGRCLLGIDEGAMRSVYREEARRWPGTKVSKRLSECFGL